MLQDDSRYLSFTQSVDVPVDLKEVCDLLRHRDEERQYSGVKTLFSLPVAGKRSQSNLFGRIMAPTMAFTIKSIV